uniref:G-protein coupled receptors family 1 profile domain-containing protein n=1 Tax=Plectus sambesii TaxID=2011161 RepID=A0A914XNC5_9BILA
MNNSESDPAASKEWENIVAASVIGVLSLITLSAYILVIVILFRNLKTFAKNSYYTLALSLAFSDSTMLALFLFYSVPCTLLHKRIFGDTFDLAMGVICNVVYFAGLTCMSLTAINRYWAVCRFASYARVYSTRNVVILVCFIWLVGIISGTFQALPCCYLRYFYDEYTYGYDMELWGNHYYIWYDRSVNSITFITIIACYSLIIMKKPSKMGGVRNPMSTQVAQGQVRRANLEKRLALQSGIIAVVLIIFGLSFTIVPELTTYKWFYLLTSVLYIINNGCNPFIYFFFNNAIRNGFMALLGLKTFCGETTVVPLERTIAVNSVNRTKTMQSPLMATAASMSMMRKTVA